MNEVMRSTAFAIALPTYGVAAEVLTTPDAVVTLAMTTEDSW